MSLRSRFIAGVVLVLFGTFGLATIGVSYLVLRQNDGNGLDTARLGASLTLNQLRAMQDGVLERARNFATSPGNLVDLKYLEAKKAEAQAAFYTFTLDRPKEEMAEQLHGVALLSGVEQFRLYDRGGDLLVLVEHRDGRTTMGIRSALPGGTAIFKYQHLVAGAEIVSPWVPGPWPEAVLLPALPPDQREWWYGPRGQGLAFLGRLAISRPQDDSWGEGTLPLGQLVFEKSLDAEFLQRISREIGMTVGLGAAPPGNGEGLTPRIVRVGADEYYQVDLPLAGLNGVAGSVTVALSRHNTLMKARENIALLLLLLGLCMAAAVPAAYLLAAGQGRRFQRILGAVERITRGDLATRAKVDRGDELGQLAAAINEMAGDLQGLVARLQESEGLLRATLESTNEGVLVVDDNGRISHFNQRFANLWRIPAEQLEPGNDRQLMEFVLPQIVEPKAFVARVEAIYQTTEAFEDVVNLRDGRILERFTAPVLRAGGHRSRVWSFLDVSERMRAAGQIKASLAEAEQSGSRLQAILHSVPHGLIVSDLAGEVVLLNRTAELFFAWDQARVPRRSIRELMPEIPLEEHLAADGDGGPSLHPVDLERYDHHRNEMRTIQVGFSPVLNRDGAMTGIVFILVDVTQEREVARLKRDFISIAAHELNTPLTAVMGYVELLMEDPDSPTFSAGQRREFLSIVYEKSEALSRIVDELLLLSRMENGGAIQLELVSFPAQEAIRKVVDLFAIGTQHGRFELALPPTALEVLGDRGKLIQVLENLVSNALKYSPGDSPVRVFCCGDAEQWSFGVEDRGIGMTAEQIERIFEKFYRADTSTTAVGGLGLGMSIVKNIVDAHGGSVDIVSSPGRGTRVAVHLPSRPSLA